ncbi:MAG TPA: hypothetical protein VK435_08400 [Thermodesulfovibrionales bacterium]|nr:hypothetical protein [Thermodesulfovibrionales bacterium]
MNTEFALGSAKRAAAPHADRCMGRQKSNAISHVVAGSITSLQRSVGNRTLQRLLLQDTGESLSANRTHEDTNAGGAGLQPRTPSGSTPVQEIHPLESLRNYRGCLGEQNFYVELAQTRAPVWVSSTIVDLEDHLSRPRDTISAIESTLNRFFHPPAGVRGTIGGRHRRDTVQRITGNLRRMRTALANPRLFCCVDRRTCGRENSAHDPDAFAYAGLGTVISICPNFFNQPVNDQVSTLIHESAHHIGLMRNVIPRDDVVNLPLNQALTNAESYALLVGENLTGPPLPPAPAPPDPLTVNWSPAYMSSEVMLNEPVRELFYEGRGRRHYLSSVRRSIESASLENRPIRFRGQIRFYVDTEDVRMPASQALPAVNTQVLFTPFGAGDNVREISSQYSRPARYLGAEMPLLVNFSPDFNFLLTENGRLRMTFWMSDQRGSDFYAMYDDTVTVRPDNTI